MRPGDLFTLTSSRCLLGDEDFWAGVQAYVDTYQHQVVETADFRRCLEASSGRSLARFFDQWLYSPGYPKLKLSFSHDAERGEIVLNLEQTQVDKDKGISTFHFDLDIAIEASAGDWSRHTIEVSGAHHSLVIPLAAAPKQIVVDPQSAVLHRLDFEPGNDMLRRSVRAEHNPHLPGRIQAAITLCSSRGRDNIRAVADAWEAEPHWGVRMVMARALGDCGAQEAARVLSEKLVSETDPRIMKYLTAACGKYRDPSIAKALRKWLEGDSLPYLAHAGALGALAAQQHDQDLPLLIAAVGDQQGWGLVRRGALAALGKHRSNGAMDELMARVGYGSDKASIRSAAVEALGANGRWQNKARRQQALEVLSDLVRDPSVGVRGAAGRALKVLGERGGLAAMETLCHSLPPQEVPRVRKAMEALAKSAEEGPTVSGLRKELEGVTEKLRKLEQRLDVVEARSKD